MAGKCFRFLTLNACIDKRKGLLQDFLNPFPRITIKPNGDPDYDSSSSSECKIATVTDVTSWVEVTVDGAITSTATSAYSTA